MAGTGAAGWRSWRRGRRRNWRRWRGGRRRGSDRGGRRGRRGGHGRGRHGRDDDGEAEPGLRHAAAQRRLGDEVNQADVMVTGVDADLIAQHAGERRPEDLQLDKAKLTSCACRGPKSGEALPQRRPSRTSGCGGTETVGSEGGYSPLGTAGPDAGRADHLSYVLSTAANSDCGGAIFADDFVNTPEPAYLQAVIKDVAARFCIDEARVFLSGYSSGAFETITLGCASSDILRGIGIQIGGGLRIKHPPCKPNPVAAMFVVGLQDTENPIGPLATPLHDSLGTAPRATRSSRGTAVRARTTRRGIPPTRMRESSRAARQVPGRLVRDHVGPPADADRPRRGQVPLRGALEVLVDAAVRRHPALKKHPRCLRCDHGRSRSTEGL